MRLPMKQCLRFQCLLLFAIVMKPHEDGHGSSRARVFRFGNVLFRPFSSKRKGSHQSEILSSLRSAPQNDNALIERTSAHVILNEVKNLTSPTTGSADTLVGDVVRAKARIMMFCMRPQPKGWG